MLTAALSYLRDRRRQAKPARRQAGQSLRGLHRLPAARLPDGQGQAGPPPAGKSASLPAILLGGLAMTSASLFLLQTPFVFSNDDKIKIVTSTSTFASITQEVVGDKAEIYSIASPHRDIHFISPTPKDIVKLKKADVFIHGGLDLEVWRGPLLDAVGKVDLMWPTGEKQIDVSKGISLLEVPENISRALGDIHLYGNPHYWTDPENAKVIASNIAEGMARIFPEGAVAFKENVKRFNEKMDEKIKDWSARLVDFKGTPFIAYHRNWSYFANRFGLVELGELEPKPGIPPTAKHFAKLAGLMKEKKVRLIFKESYQESRTPHRLAEETGATVLTLSQSVGDPKEASDYAHTVEYNIRLIEQTRKP